MRNNLVIAISLSAILSMSATSSVFAQESRDPLVKWLFSNQGITGPQGVIVADSGFRPYPDGFGFFNFGQDLRTNQLVFAQPEPLAAGVAPVKPVALGPNDMRAMFGPGACLDTNATGPCVLTYSSQVVLDQTTDWAIGGRCFGMSNVAAGFYSGQVPARELNGGAVNAFTTLNPDVQKKILRTVTSQYFSSSGSPVTSMRRLIDQLIADFSKKRISHTLLVYGAPGGHALTPFAVFDRGAGLFDIAVYDSNHPNRELAIQVNTTNNSFTYSGTTQVGVPPQVWNSEDATEPASLWVGSVASALGIQDCVFCARNSSDVLVSFSPIPRENAGIMDNIKVLSSSGLELDPSLYQRIQPIDSVGSPFVNGPVIRVTPGVPFAIALSGLDAQIVRPFTMTITQAGSTRKVSMDPLSQQTSGFVGVGSTAKSVSVLGTAFERINVVQTLERRGISYSFSGTQLTGGSGGGLYMRVNDKKKRVYFRDNRGRKSTWRLDLRSSQSENSGAWVSTIVRVPRQSQIIVEYSKFKGGEGKPLAWIDINSNGSKDKSIQIKAAGQ